MSIPWVNKKEQGEFVDYIGALGEEYVNLQTGTIIRGTLVVRTSNETVYPDGLVDVANVRNVIEEVKVGW